MAFRDGILLFRHSGLIPEDGLRSLVEQLRGLDMNEIRAKLEAPEPAAEADAES
jgi:thioredoxin 1